MTLATSVDLDRYPIDALGTPEAAAVLERHRTELAGDGVSILPGFLTPAATQAMVEEADALTGLGHHQDVEGTPYLGLPDPDAPAGDPRGHLERSALTTIARDRFPVGSPLRSLYEDDALLRFVSAVVERGPLHRDADPLGALNVAVMGHGDELGWHFDSSDLLKLVRYGRLPESPAGAEDISC